MEYHRRIRDNKGREWICIFKSLPGSVLFISLHSSIVFRFIVGNVKINNKGKTVNILDFKTKGDGQDFSGIGLGSQIYNILENYLRSIGIRKIFGDIAHIDEKAPSFWKNRGYTLEPIEHNDTNKYKMYKELV